ncbi:MAG: UDP-N-acetylenolpyruvoylglucosamine reductase [Francisellaceae bacterium]|nr:UDP-N-acetylenolpyruvoylglucosamine reductase [Francisellaceae bacterium]
MLPLDEPLTWLGLGSNVLISDKGIEGTVIHTLNALNELKVEQGLVIAQAGVTCAKLARFTGSMGLSGAEFFAGIPGTVGGAIRMNAGAFEADTWQFIEFVESINRKGQIIKRVKDDFEIAYRNISLKTLSEEEWFVSAAFKFSKSENQIYTDKIKELLRKRSQAQPIGFLSCGSVFKNPPGYYAAKLIEYSNLKGYSIGGAKVSEKHANFIINYDHAQSGDVNALIAYIRDKVVADHNILLHPEVCMIGRQ